uniref:tRNA-specific adenosine deaminase 1 n=3 Tax=Drosophila melanogaster TaxID=7227 RepID=ADAT1_DROME|nr:adenosine deaminase, tRNA-specific 1, isoform B [Drosophila melanogaster]NP_609676.1 adenosine deaminase, tRNA-specific 1, isoform A [Drosophila melanogaster]Q9V3R6.1 RecName: Full=tRNA-specific adenosine deaminase 1; AltName: Full=dADAT1; AltName: Full=tRNA-specific adenosine-37 deaminase [Drosophila melanogaster]AAF06773.1 tRNA-specific adenosine deaminase [Drosophila melanogaster]AAF53333.1 adenosine deaminase, tRNA-specific 1, isoform A [Drosophila melanogaster]AGB92985.1 adenosine deam|eukprot:NP_001260450.1 adenosine deaminase, tRNA-specific 1, isoform B [Drosophila melanogaster]
MCDNKKPTVKEIAELCLKKFESLPKTGKPTANQWTILAGIVEFNRNTEACQLVSLGCGTKCIGESKLCPNGLILNDSHAEVLARRGFLRFLYQELKQDRIFHWNSTLSTYDMDEHVEFHFLSTQTPCGDACILEEEQPAARAKRQRLDEDSEMVYTGAKLISDLSDDPMLQTPGALRTKPGRGERTLSMSCSDKIARWNVIGVQGALLDVLISKPIYFSSLNFCCDDAQLESLERAIFKRFDCRTFKHTRFQPQRPQINIDPGIRFEFSQRSDWQPSPNGLIWSQVPEELRPYEISVNGKRQGVTKKKMKTSQAALAISKYKLFLTFLELVKFNPKLSEMFDQQLSDPERIAYASCKDLARDYQFAWREIKEKYFLQWTKKPHELLDFNPMSNK